MCICFQVFYIWWLQKIVSCRQTKTCLIKLKFNKKNISITQYIEKKGKLARKVTRSLVESTQTHGNVSGICFKRKVWVWTGSWTKIAHWQSARLEIWRFESQFRFKYFSWNLIMYISKAQIISLFSFNNLIWINLFSSDRERHLWLELFIFITYFSTVIPLTSCVSLPVGLLSLMWHFQQVL